MEEIDAKRTGKIKWQQYEECNKIIQEELDRLEKDKQYIDLQEVVKSDIHEIGE